ncbi:hypothetical protein ACQ4PT_021163 [Festuca glaucescens]
MEGTTSALWSIVPPRFSAMLLRYLPCHADQIRFAVVCRRWRSQALKQPRHPPLPWIALPDGRLISFPGPGPPPLQWSAFPTARGTVAPAMTGLSSSSTKSEGTSC